MSLILDALRKMEQERKSRHAGTVDIRPAVLHRRGDDPPAPRNLAMLVIAGAVLLLAGIGAGLFIKQEKPAPPLPQPAEQAAMVPEARPASPVTPPPSAPVPAEPVRPVPAAIVRPGAPAPPPRSAVAEEEPTRTSGPADRGITISGIAWQDERSLRRAVVNGSLVGEGAEIAGARIIEIRERSVRFSREGSSFDVSYTSAFPSR